MILRIVAGLVASLVATNLAVDAQNMTIGALTPIADVKFTGQRAVNIAQALAERYKVVISVSGILLGPDDRLVSVSVVKGTLKDALDAIVYVDPRLTWSQESDGAIAITVKGGSLTVLDVVVASFGAENPSRFGLSSKIAKIPEIEDWLARNACEMDEIVITPPKGTWNIAMHESDLRLRSLLNEIASRSKTYFWAAIQYSDHPCEINLHP